MENLKDTSLANREIQDVQKHEEFFSMGIATELTKGNGVTYSDQPYGRWGYSK